MQNQQIARYWTIGPSRTPYSQPAGNQITRTANGSRSLCGLSTILPTPTPQAQAYTGNEQSSYASYEIQSEVLEVWPSSTHHGIARTASFAS